MTRNLSWNNTMNIECNYLISFQYKIALRWFNRGKEIQEHSGDIFSLFFSFFAGFNALYFLWDRLNKNSNNKQEMQIEGLINKFNDTKVQQLFEKLEVNLNFFSERSPIQKMNTRTCKEPYKGHENAGTIYKDILRSKKYTEKDKIITLGKIIYIVRCNLVHGSKEDSGDDKKIIGNCIQPLKELLIEALELTKKEFPGV